MEIIEFWWATADAAVVWRRCLWWWGGLAAVAAASSPSSSLVVKELAEEKRAVAALPGSRERTSATQAHTQRGEASEEMRETTRERHREQAHWPGPLVRAGERVSLRVFSGERVGSTRKRGAPACGERLREFLRTNASEKHAFKCTKRWTKPLDQQQDARGTCEFSWMSCKQFVLCLFSRKKILAPPSHWLPW